MTDYIIRPATLADVQTINYHRCAMFAEMGVFSDEVVLERFASWLQQAIANQFYFGWLVKTETGEVVAGGGLTLLSRPPTPLDLNDHSAYVYNVYTEPAHRRRGLARRLLETMHQWCRVQGLKTVALHASDFGRPLYESLGYIPTSEMRLTLED